MYRFSPRLARQGPRRAVAPLTLAALLVALPSPAVAASPNTTLSGTKSTGLAKVLSPTPSGLVKGGSAHIRVRLRPGATSFQAWLGVTDVTRLFRRRGNERVATISAARTQALRLGVNHLFVRVRGPGNHRDFDAVSFTRARRMPSLLVQRLTGRVVGGGHVRITFLVARRSATIRASLNGHRLRGLGGQGRHRRSYVLDGDDGLKFGLNRLVFVGIHKLGRFDVERRTIRIPRSAPIPSAGHPRRVLAKRIVRLDARRSRAGRKGAKLGFAWRIVKAPKRSKAKLRGITSARPRLRPDRVGIYKLRLTVSERRAGAAVAAAAHRSSDTITLRATPPILPVGVAIDTMGGPIGEGMTLGAPLTERFIAPNRNEQVQMVALDRTDLSQVANNSYTGDQPGTAQLLSDVRALNSNDIVVITTPASSHLRQITDPQAVTNLNQAVEAIGGADLPSKIVTTDNCLPLNNSQLCTSFSVIGVPGQDANTAAENAGLTLVAGNNVGDRGSLRGYLQADQNGNYRYVSPDFASFDTSTSASTASQNVMSINGQTYPSATLPDGQAGFQLVVLGADDLHFELNETYPVSGTGLSDFDAASGLAAIDGLIAQAANDPTQLVFLQTIGSVQRNDAGGQTTASWNILANDMSGMGSHAFYFDALNGQGDGGTFTFVGPGDAPSFLSPWAQTASTLATATAGRLAGLLARNSLSQYYPEIAGPKPSLDLSLPSIAYQNPQPWPDRDTPGHLDAIACITAAVGVPAPIETNYWTNQNFPFASVQSSVGQLDYNSSQANNGLPDIAACENQQFTEQDFTDVKTQLNQELLDGQTVRNLIGNLQSPLGLSANAANANVLDIAQAIQSSLGNPNSTASGNTASALEDLMFVGAGIVPEAGAALGVAASLAALANTALGDSSGGPLLANVQTNATQLLVTLANNYQALWGQMGATGEILLSDWGKLHSAAQRALTSWAWSTQNTTNGADALTAGSKLFTFESLVPLQYVTYDFADGGYRQSLSVPPTDGRDYQCPSHTLQFPDSEIPALFVPFSGGPSTGLTIVTGAGPTKDLWILGNKDQTFLSNDADKRTTDGPIPASVYKAIFTDPTNPDIKAPALPSELRFDLDVYQGPNELTSNGGFDPDVYCKVNGARPSG